MTLVIITLASGVIVQVRVSLNLIPVTNCLECCLIINEIEYAKIERDN